jgi:predicted nucleotidyltransferase
MPERNARRRAASSRAKQMESLSKKLKLAPSERDALSKLVTEVRASWPDAKFKLFGSKVTGTADEESDLDILILLPGDVTRETRQRIIHMVFDINLALGTNISPLILSEQEWNRGLVTALPIHYYIEEEGVPYE